MRIGCNTNCTRGLVPMKCENALKILGSITDVKFIIKCCSKNTIRNNPERAIAIFLPIEDLKILFIKNNFISKINSQTNQKQELSTI